MKIDQNRQHYLPYHLEIFAAKLFLLGNHKLKTQIL